MTFRFFSLTANSFEAPRSPWMETLPAASPRCFKVWPQAVSGSFFCDVILAFVDIACARATRWDEGLRHVEEGIRLTETNLERLYAAELRRVKGELLLEQAETSKHRKGAAARRMVDAARRCLHRALEIARKQEAGSLALRSAMSLTRLAGRHGGAREARALLRSAVHLLHGRLRHERPQRSKSAPDRIERLITNGVLLAATGGDSSGLIHIFITSCQRARQFGRSGDGRGKIARTSRHPVAVRS